MLDGGDADDAIDATLLLLTEPMRYAFSLDVISFTIDILAKRVLPPRQANAIVPQIMKCERAGSLLVRRFGKHLRMQEFLSRMHVRTKVITSPPPAFRWIGITYALLLAQAERARA